MFTFVIVVTCISESWLACLFELKQCVTKGDDDVSLNQTRTGMSWQQADAPLFVCVIMI